MTAINRRIFGFGVFLFLACALSLLTCQSVSAALELKSDEEGNITWTTTPTAATTGIRWKTQGFLIYAKKTVYGYPLKSGEPYAKILVDDARVSVDTGYDNRGNYISIFTINADYTKSVIASNTKLYQQFMENISNGNPCIYFNNFFQSYRLDNGKETILTSNMYDMDSIRNDQYWSNKNEWNTGYYNIKVPYKVTGNVHVKLADEAGNYLGTPTGVTNDAGVEIRDVVIDGAAKKNPSLAFYNEKYASQGICNSNRKVYVGKEATVSLPLQVSVNGKTYELYRSYYYQTTNDTTKKNDTRLSGDRNGTLQKSIRIGLQSSMVVGRYKETGSPPNPPDPPKPEEGEVMEGIFTEPEPEGEIGSGNPENQPFRVTEGIPVTDSLYTRLRTAKYLAGYRFARKNGAKTWTARGSITWNLSWMEGEGEEAQMKTAVRTVVYSAPVTRTYSYWEIGRLEVYRLAGGVVENGAFPSGSVQLIPAENTCPSVIYRHDPQESAHVMEPAEIGTVLDLGSMSYSASSPPAFDASGLLEARIGPARVKNDRLVFDGTCVMDATVSNTAAPRPDAGGVNTNPENIGARILYEESLIIPMERANGEYAAVGNVTYTRAAAVNPEKDAVLTFPVTDINPVIVHTPVVCSAKIEDLKKYCQMLHPDLGRAPLILGMEFRLSLPTFGAHREIPGYGTGDYGRYTAKRQVKFPFDVCRGTERIPAGTWTPVAEETEFFLPIWVEEGKYEVEFRSISLNTYANQGWEKAEPDANLDTSHYVATDVIPVEVSGRMYGLTITGVRDAGIWKSCFYQENGMPSNVTFGTGCLDQNGLPNGRELSGTFPMVAGDHPHYRNVGILKRGYTAEFELTTVGDYEKEPVGVELRPGFSVINRDGSGRREVDVYYTEVFDSDGAEHELVKAGSMLDRRNLKWKEGYPVFTAGKILLPAGLRSLQAGGRIQTWKGEYRLPVRLHVCEKGFPLDTWIAEHGTVDYQEPFWIRNGYLLVNLDIVSLQKEKPYLDYRNEEREQEGYCNMWRLEGGVKKKQDSSGAEFEFRCGDFLLYDLEHSLWEDAGASALY